MGAESGTESSSSSGGDAFLVTIIPTKCILVGTTQNIIICSFNISLQLDITDDGQCPFGW